MKKYKRTVVAVMSDSHAGFSLGLCNPETRLQYDDGTHRPIALTSSQEYLWQVHMTAKQAVMDLAGKDDVVLFHIGDNTHGTKYISEQSSTRIADQFLIAVANFQPWLQEKNVKTVRIAKGTASHVFGEGSSEVIVEELLHSQFPKKSIKTLYHGLCNIHGVTIDYAHHGPTPGSRSWLRGNEARYYLRSLMMDEIALGNIPARLVLRGHYHTYTKETVVIPFRGEEYESTLCILPAMCMLGDYGRQATRSAFVTTVGMVAFEIIDGKLAQSYKFTDTKDIRTREDL